MTLGVTMSYRTFAVLIALASATFGAFRYFVGDGPLWQIPVLTVVGFSAPYVFALAIWVAITPDDAVGVAKEMLSRVRNRGRNV